MEQMLEKLGSKGSGSTLGLWDYLPCCGRLFACSFSSLSGTAEAFVKAQLGVSPFLKSPDLDLSRNGIPQNGNMNRESI